MAWNMDSDRAIYVQIVERIQMQIVSGYYAPGGKLPTVRDLAAEAAVNPNTMQKAFSELERSGLINTQRTSGRTVTEDVALINRIRDDMAKGHVREFVSKMQELGYDKASMAKLLDSDVQETI